MIFLFHSGLSIEDFEVLIEGFSNLNLEQMSLSLWFANLLFAFLSISDYWDDLLVSLPQLRMVAHEPFFRPLR